MNFKDLSPLDLKSFAMKAEETSKSILFVSFFYLKRPDKEFFNKITSDEFKLALKEVSSDKKFEESLRYFDKFYKEVEKSKDEGIINNLQVDWTKLIRGIKKGYSLPPPYESVWRGEDAIMESFTQEVIKFYVNSGTGIDLNGEIPDHIGIELKFLSILAYLEKEGWESEDEEKVKISVKLQKEFLEKHILTWVPFFCERMFEKAETAFYKAVSLFTKNFLSDVKERTEELFCLLND